MTLKRRVRGGDAETRSSGVGSSTSTAAAIDDPRLGAVSAALSRLRPQLVPDPSTPDPVDHYLAHTEYAAVARPADDFAPAEVAPAAERHDEHPLGRWAASLALVAEPSPAPVREPEPARVAAVAPVPASLLAAIADAVAGVRVEEAPLEATPVEAIPIEAIPVDAIPVGAIPLEAGSSIDAGPVWATTFDGTLLPRAPLYRPRISDRMKFALRRSHRRRRKY